MMALAMATYGQFPSQSSPQALRFPTHTLLLSTAQETSTLSDFRVVAVRKLRDKVVSIGTDASCLDQLELLLGRQLFERTAEQTGLDVGTDGAAEKRGLLRDQPDLLAQPPHIHRLDVDSIQQDTPSERVIEAQDEGRNGALAAARSADEGVGLARFEDQAEARLFQDRDVRPTRVRKGNVLELDPAVDGVEADALVAFTVDRRDALDGLEDFGSGTAGFADGPVSRAVVSFPYR